MDKITEALKKILPAEHVNEVVKAVETIVAEQISKLEEEFQANLDKAYEQLAEERRQDEAVAEKGYQQAYEIVASLMNRVDEQRVEFETALEEGFEEAFADLEKEKAKNENIEVELYKEFDKKLQDMKELMVDKMDQFLSMQEAEIYENAKKDILSDPRLAEQKIAVEKMAEILSDYMSNDDFQGVTSSKLEETLRQIDGLKGQLRIVEAKNVRLSAQNKKLGDQVNEAHEIITEATKVERKERAKKTGIASGRGQRVMNNEQIINEFVNPTTQSNKDQEVNEAHDPLNDLLVLSGLSQS